MQIQTATWRRLAGSAAIGALLVLPACRDDGTAAGASSITKAEYEERAGAACTRFGEELARLYEGVDQGDLAEQARLAPEVRALYWRFADEVRAIPVPEGHEDEVRAIIDANDRATELLDPMFEAARRGDEAAFAASAEAHDAAATVANDLVAEYDVPACVS